MEEQRKGTETGTNTNTKETDNKSTGGRTGGGKKGESNSKPIEENLVKGNTPKEVEIEIPPIVEKEEKKTTPKKPRKNTKKKTTKKKEGIESKDLSMMLQGVFGIMSMRMGSIWQISEEESKSIAEPLARILDRMEISEKFEGASDGIVLTIATTSVVLPRVIVSNETRKQKKKDQLMKNGVLKSEGSITEVSTTDVGSGEEGTTNVGQHIKSLHTEVY